MGVEYSGSGSCLMPCIQVLGQAGVFIWKGTLCEWRIDLKTPPALLIGGVFCVKMWRQEICGNVLHQCADAIAAANQEACAHDAHADEQGYAAGFGRDLDKQAVVVY